MTEQVKCLVCDVGELIQSESVRLVEIDGIQKKVPVRAHTCTSCGVVQGTEEDVRFNARAMRKATKETRRQLTGAEVREIRRRLSLTQEEAARIFGGGPVAFSKYENDEVSQSEAMDRLIWLAGTYPWVVAALASRVGIELSTQANLIIERFQIEYREGLLRQAKAVVRHTALALEGFSVAFGASNDDRIYRPNTEAMTKLKHAA